jgi:hypothetical protein
LENLNRTTEIVIICRHKKTLEYVGRNRRMRSPSGDVVDVFITWALGGGECSVSCFSCFTTRKEPLGVHSRGGSARLRTDLNKAAMRKIDALSGNPNQVVEAVSGSLCMNVLLFINHVFGPGIHKHNSEKTQFYRRYSYKIRQYSV